MDDRAAVWRPPAGRRFGLGLAGAAGAVWGLAGYAVLWGHTPLTVHRSFVVSAVGTVTLLPVRIVLWGIRVVEERLMGRPFSVASRNEWIGVVAAVVGAGMVALTWTVARAGVRRVRRHRPAR